MAVRRFVLNVRRRDRDATRLFFRRLVDLVIRRELGPALLGQNLRDRGRQRRLAMVNVTNRSNVAMRLIPLEFLFGHNSSIDVQTPPEAGRFWDAADLGRFRGNRKRKRD